jgi:hypothetical protein
MLADECADREDPGKRVTEKPLNRCLDERPGKESPRGTGSSPVHPAIVLHKISPLFLFGVFLKWVEYFQPRAPEISVIPRDNRQIVTASSRGDIAVFDRHSLACQLKSSLLVRPYMRYRDIEAVNASMHRLDKPRQPCLQALSRFSVFAPHPIG